MAVKRHGIVFLFFLLVTTTISCSVSALPGEGLLPQGIENAEIPDVEEVGGYLYFNSDSPLTLTHDFFRPFGGVTGPEFERVALDQAALVLGPSVA